MTTTNPLEDNARKITAISSSVQNLHTKVRLSSLVDKIGDLNNTVDDLPQQIKDLRSRNYAFGKDLEAEAADLGKRWKRSQPSTRRKLEQEVSQLQVKIKPLEAQMNRLSRLKNNPRAAGPLIAQLESGTKSLESETTAAESVVSGMFNDLESDMNQLKWQIHNIEWMLNEIEEATFTFLTSEAGIKAVKAKWIEGKEDKGDPEGILYLTDQRLLFEQKQKIATKKMLFVTTKSEMVQELLYEIPITAVEEIETSKRGMLKNEDHIELTFRSEAPVVSAHIHLDGQDCEDWKVLISKAKIRDFDSDRAIEIDQEVIEKIQSAPTQCPQCGAAMPQNLLRGQESITCEYCSFTVRL
jgi:chromosome segregation ATPase